MVIIIEQKVIIQIEINIKEIITPKLKKEIINKMITQKIIMKIRKLKQIGKKEIIDTMITQMIIMKIKKSLKTPNKTKTKEESIIIKEGVYKMLKKQKIIKLFN